MQFITYYYYEKEKLENYEFNEKLQDIQTKFEDIYLYTYYPLSTIEYSSNNNEIIVDTETDTLMFEDHVDDFFKYAVKQIHASKNDLLHEIKQYLEKQIAIRTTNIFE
ncbi:4287_t:CDS:2, partial [Scutellospora calospora]